MRALSRGLDPVRKPEDHVGFQPREVCFRCRRARGGCYCRALKRFRTGFDLILLAHPKEARNRVGTVRIAHLSVENSLLIQGKGQDIDESATVRLFLDRSRYFPVVLFPGSDALGPADLRQGGGLRPEGARLAVFVIDGTWHQANRMMKTSRVLQSLPRLSFKHERPSEYQFRTQPKPFCLSTVEAVHTIITKFDHSGVCAAPHGHVHDGMLTVFRELVRFQVECEKSPPVKALEGVDSRPKKWS